MQIRNGRGDCSARPAMNKPSFCRFLLLSALIAGCGSNPDCPGPTSAPDLAGLASCGPGTKLSNGSCIATTMGSGLTCGANTAASDGGTCEVTSSVCGTNTAPSDGGTCEVTPKVCNAPGIVFDPSSDSCVLQMAPGMPLASNNFIVEYKSLYYDAGNGMFQPLNGQQPGTTKLYNKLGVPLGGWELTIKYPVGPNATMFTIFGSDCSYDMATNTVKCARDPTAQVTLNDWQFCAGVANWYKTPILGKTVDRLVVEVSGCVRNSLYSVWTLTTTTGLLADATTIAPAGGLPNVMVTDSSGHGHFETFYDPSVWFIPGEIVPYAGGFMNQATVASGQNAAALTMVGFQSNAQTNPMGDFCIPIDQTKPFDPITNPCTMPPPGIYEVGPTDPDFHAQLVDEPGAPLMLLKP
jgi:hypothetical protein